MSALLAKTRHVRTPALRGWFIPAGVGEHASVMTLAVIGILYGSMLAARRRT